MTMFGAIWLLLLLYALAKNNKRMIITLVLFSCVFQSSNVFVFGDTAIGPQIISSAVVSVYFLLYKVKSGKFLVTKEIFSIDKTSAVLFLYIVVISVALGAFADNYIRIFQLMFYMLCFFIMKDAGAQLPDDYVYVTLRKLAIFILVVGVFQLLCTTNIIPRYWFIRDLFWNESAGNGEVAQFMWPWGPYFRFFSTYLEPSYFVGFSIGALFYFVNYKEKRNQNYILIAGLAMATVLSFSSSGYGALLITGIIYIAFSREGKMRGYILAGGLASFVIMYFGFYDILDNVIFSKLQSGSAYARATWNLEALKTFNSSPIWGVGYKNCRASSMFYTILAELGTVGFVLYSIFMFSIIKPILSKKKKLKIGDEHVGIIFALIGVTASQMIAVPDLDICTFWMWMYFLGLIIGRNKRRLGESRCVMQ